MVRNIRLLAVAALLAAPGAAHAAGDADSRAMIIANDLATILASEEMCGLSYDQAAIAKYVADTVPPEAMGFAGQLNMMTTGAKFSLEGMNESSKTAHCAAVLQTAASFGFLN